MKGLQELTSIIEAKKTRGAWSTGVKLYALEILEDMKDRAYYEQNEPQTIAELYDYMLNGAKDWRHPHDIYKAWSVYSWGGSSLIYDGDICERLCNNTEKKQTRNGERQPNSREQWLDVQARALFQAGELIAREAREA